jgi:hypothetical protein
VAERRLGGSLWFSRLGLVEWLAAARCRVPGATGMGADGRAKWRRWLSGRRLGRNQGALKQTPMARPLNSASR